MTTTAPFDISTLTPEQLSSIFSNKQLIEKYTKSDSSFLDSKYELCFTLIPREEVDTSLKAGKYACDGFPMRFIPPGFIHYVYTDLLKDPLESRRAPSSLATHMALWEDLTESEQFNHEASEFDPSDQDSDINSVSDEEELNTPTHPGSKMPPWIAYTGSNFADQLQAILDAPPGSLPDF